MLKQIFHIHCPYSKDIKQFVPLLPLGAPIDEYLADISDYSLSGFLFWETCSFAHVDKIRLAGAREIKMELKFSLSESEACQAMIIQKHSEHTS